jgi:hypothetical protein
MSGERREYTEKLQKNPVILIAEARKNEGFRILRNNIINIYVVVKLFSIPNE